MRLSLSHVWTILSATVVALSAVAAQGDDGSAYQVRDLYKTCSVAPDSADYAVATYACLAFIGGAVQYHDAVSDRKHLKRLICYPKGATVTDGRDAFVAWGKRNLANEERMGEIAVIGLVRALGEKYPCK